MKKYKARGKKRDRKGREKFNEFDIFIPVPEGMSEEDENEIFTIVVKAAQETIPGLLKVECDGFYTHQEHKYY